MLSRVLPIHLSAVQNLLSIYIYIPNPEIPPLTPYLTYFLSYHTKILLSSPLSHFVKFRRLRCLFTIILALRYVQLQNFTVIYFYLFILAILYTIYLLYCTLLFTVANSSRCSSIQPICHRTTIHT